MATNIRLTNSDHEHATDLGTAGSWSPAAEWLGALPPDLYPLPVKLAADGAVNDTATLAIQLEDAFALHRPTDSEVADTIDRLLDRLGNGRPDERLTIE